RDDLSLETLRGARYKSERRRRRRCPGPETSLKPVIAISIGCPSGIGPEVSVAAAARCRDASSVLVGEPWVIERACTIVGVAKRRLIHVPDPGPGGIRLPAGALGVFSPRGGSLGRREAPFGRPGPAAGRAQLAWIDAATDLVERGIAGALVT